jgi:asparagine N-glycosylation enzyme membrane subunit Stt3
MTEGAPTTNVRGGSLRLRWGLLALAAIAGTIGFSIVSSAGLRVGLSFLGGLALVVGCFEFGGYNIRFTARYLPHLTMAIALLTYGMTVAVLALVLAVSSPRVVDGPAVAIGLFVGLTVWIGTEILRTRVRSERA